MTYLRRADQIKPGDIDVELGLAAIHLRKRDVKSAIESYLDIIEAHPKSAMARWALDYLRKNADESSIAELVDTGRISKFYPRITRPFPTIAVSLTLLGACVLGFGVYLGLELLPQKRELRLGMEGADLSLSEREHPTSQSVNALFILTEKQITDAYDKAKALMLAYRDNAAVKELNLIKNSNASDYVKAKAEQLLALVSQPDMKSIRDAPEYPDVAKQPVLYADAYVKWKGRVANYRASAVKSEFDFLVGYHDKQTLQGIIPVSFPRDLGLDLDNPIELLARVKVSSGLPVLEGIAIHDLSYAQQD